MPPITRERLAKEIPNVLRGGDRERFLDVFPSILKELLDAMRSENQPDHVISWYERSLVHNAPGGKLYRGITVPISIEILNGKPLSDEEYKRYAILGWAVELLQACVLVADDMMDGSTTRRDQPAWYCVPGVSNVAIIDAFMLQSAVFQLLKKHFRHEPYYIDLLELFNDCTYRMEIGQLADTISVPEHDFTLSQYTLEYASQIAVYKAGFYSFELPVGVAMRVQGISDPEAYKLLREIASPIGEYGQFENDYLDCLSFPPVVPEPKYGTDIVDGKNNWVICVALQLASPEQRKILEENYGKGDTECEKRVLEVYSALPLQSKFVEYREETYERTMRLIDKVPEDGPMKRNVYLAFLGMLFKRLAI